VLDLSVLVPEAQLILSEKYDNVRTTFFNFRAEHLHVTATTLISGSINTLRTGSFKLFKRPFPRLKQF